MIVANPSSPSQTKGTGQLAALNGKVLPLRVLRSHAGYYIGTQSSDGPYTRESEEYWPKAEVAQQALLTGDWTQRRWL